MTNPQPGERVYWWSTCFDRVELVRPFKPLGQDIEEWVVRTSTGHLFIVAPTDLKRR